MNLFDLFSRASTSSAVPGFPFDFLVERVGVLLNARPVSRVDRPAGLLIIMENGHMGPPTQRKILNSCALLHREFVVPLMLCEGAEGRLMTELYSFFPNRAAKQSVSEKMLSTGKQSGSEAFCIVSDNPPQLFGIDSAELHKANTDAADRARKNSAAAEILDRLGPWGGDISSWELRALCRLEMTSSGLESLLATAGGFDGLQAVCALQASESAISRSQKIVVQSLLTAAIDFYRCAAQRSQVMAGSALRCVAENHVHWAIADVTGFHSGTISDTFTRHNWIVIRHPVLA